MWSGQHNRGLQFAAGIALFCVLATAGLSLRALWSAYSLQAMLDRGFALASAQQRLTTTLSRGDSAGLDETLEGLIRQAAFGFRYVSVRDTDGSILAARGRYESLNRNESLPPALRRWLRATLYTAFADTGLLTLRDGDRTMGSLEYSIGSSNAQLVRDEAVDRLHTFGWVGATLALMFAAATLLLLRAASVAVATRPKPPREAVTDRPPSPARSLLSGGPDAPHSFAAFDELQIGVIDTDQELRIRALNETARLLTGWEASSAIGQLVYTVFHVRDEAGAPLPSPAERCVREDGEQSPVELRLRPRGGAQPDRMIEARAVRLQGNGQGSRMVFQDISSRVATRERLRAQARVAEGVIDQLLEAVLTTDEAGVVKSANARALRMFGYSAEEMQRMTVARLLPVPFMNTPGLKLTDYMPGGQTRMPKLAGWRKDATTFPAELVVEQMRAGGEQRLVVIIRDITEQLRSQSLAQRLGRLLDSSSEEVYIFDAQSLYFTEVNKGARRNLGLKLDQLARMSLANVATDLDPAMLQSYLGRLRGGEAEHVTYKANHRRSDGTTYPVEVRLSFSRDEEPPVFMAIAQDITEREAAEKRMRQLAHFDALTGLPNRTLLFDRLKQAMHVASRSGRQLALLFMDLDGFKPVNDAYGHEAGDALLQSVADRLNAGLRAADTVARFGGDEFVVLAQSIRDGEDAMTLANKVHDLFKTTFDIKGQKIALFTSIGVTLYPADASDAEGLLRHADAAMYESKQRGRGRTQMYALPSAGNLPRTRPQRADLAREINAGLATGQFQLQLLPVFTSAGELAASIADFYWTHPDYGRVDSRETLHAARRAGLNAELESWMLQQAVLLQQTSEQQGLSSVPVLLSLTGRQWRDPEFPERLQQRLADAGVSPKLLIPVIEGEDWSDALTSVQMLWTHLLQGGLRIAVRQPDPQGTMEAIAMVLLPVSGERAIDEAQALALTRRYAGLDRPVVIEGVGSQAEWGRLRVAGASHGCGGGLQTALTPMEYLSWATARGLRPL